MRAETKTQLTVALCLLGVVCVLLLTGFKIFPVPAAGWMPSNCFYPPPLKSSATVTGSSCDGLPCMPLGDASCIQAFGSWTFNVISATHSGGTTTSITFEALKDGVSKGTRTISRGSSGSWNAPDGSSARLTVSSGCDTLLQGQRIYGGTISVDFIGPPGNYGWYNCGGATPTPTQPPGGGGTPTPPAPTQTPTPTPPVASPTPTATPSPGGGGTPTPSVAPSVGASPTPTPSVPSGKLQCGLLEDYDASANECNFSALKFFVAVLVAAAIIGGGIVYFTKKKVI